MKTTDIVTLSTYRKNMRELNDHVNKTGRPLVVTTNGKPDAVVITAAEYDRLIANSEDLHSARIIKESVTRFESGKGVPFDSAMNDLRKRLKSEREVCDTTSKLKQRPSKKSKKVTASSFPKIRLKTQTAG
jgi:prevent-host-death family protein